MAWAMPSFSATLSRHLASSWPSPLVHLTSTGNGETNGSVTTIPLDLAGNHTKIIAFAQHPVEGGPVPGCHGTELSSNVIRLSAEDNGIVLHITAPADLIDMYHIVNWQGNPPHQPGSGLFRAQAMDPGAGALGKPRPTSATHPSSPSRHNTTHQLAELVSWNDISAETNTARVGYYHTSFT